MFGNKINKSQISIIFAGTDSMTTMADVQTNDSFNKSFTEWIIETVWLVTELTPDSFERELKVLSFQLCLPQNKLRCVLIGCSYKNV